MPTKSFFFIFQIGFCNFCLSSSHVYRHPQNSSIVQDNKISDSNLSGRLSCVFLNVLNFFTSNVSLYPIKLQNHPIFLLEKSNPLQLGKVPVIYSYHIQSGFSRIIKLYTQIKVCTFRLFKLQNVIGLLNDLLNLRQCFRFRMSLLIWQNNKYRPCVTQLKN